MYTMYDPSKVHIVVAFKQYCATLNHCMCLNHPTKQRDLRCEQCDTPVFRLCISKEHLGHEPVAILNPFESKKEVLERNLQELEKYIFPKYSNVSSSIPFQKAGLIKTHRN